MRNNKYSDIKIADPRFAAKLQSFRDGRITAPVYVRVKPINRCNHGCRWCSYKADRKTGDAMPVVASDMHTVMQEADVIPTAKMLEVLEDFKSMGVKAVTYSGGGEPLLHKNITDFMERTLFFGIDLSIITNGQLLFGERAELLAFARWVRVSMDYTTPAQMAHSRVVPERLFDQVLANLQTFARLKQPDCDLGVNYIVHRDNFEHLMPFAARLKEMGVENVRFSPMWCPDLVRYHEPHQRHVIELLELMQRQLVDERFSVNTTFDLTSAAHSPERAYTRCFFMQTVPVVGIIPKWTVQYPDKPNEWHTWIEPYVKGNFEKGEMINKKYSVQLQNNK